VSVALRDLEHCFEGMIPPAIVTCSAAGEPNVTHLSQLQIVDDDLIAASNQFFGKTVANLAENPLASVLVHDHESGYMYRLALAFERREFDGEVFEELSRRVDAIAALTGMREVFKLRSADIYRVLHCERLE
jgi:predicted pyridoxine 5'-phosphate oxidase superfamily flavin-nucleotide-binding protein